MATISVKRVVPMTAEQAFAIASDVNEYQDFLPLVTRSTIRGEVEVQGSVKRFAADMVIAIDKLGLRDSFTSHVVADAAARTVTATSQDGPMKDLRAVWTIKALDGSRSQVSIDITYQFRNMLFQLAAGRLMDQAVARVLESFETRGRQLYPESALPNI
jgi:coenzyme Q-binding protein COQ10